SATCSGCGATEEAAVQAAMGRGIFLILGLVIFITGFALGRVNSGIRGPITQASIERVTTSQDQAAAALPDELKYDAFMRSAGTQMPLGFQAWRLDQNGNLVLYFSRSDDWSALQDEERRAVMQALGIGYTAF